MIVVEVVAKAIAIAVRAFLLAHRGVGGGWIHSSVIRRRYGVCTMSP
jgi:hypothetical protein